MREAPFRSSPHLCRGFTGAFERSLEPLASLGPVPAAIPEFRAGDDEPQLRFRGLLLMPPVERRAQVVVLTPEPLELLEAQVFHVLPFVDAGLFEEVLAVSAKRRAARLLLGEALACEFADRLEHREPPLPFPDEALVDERGQGVQVALAHGLGRLERPAPGEDREPRQSLLLVLLEQVVAPGDRRPQRLLPFGCVPGPAGEEREPLLQPSEQGIGRQDLDARRRQLDRERQAVEAAADLGHGAVRGEAGSNGSRRARRRAPWRRPRAKAEPGTAAPASGGAARGSWQRV